MKTIKEKVLEENFKSVLRYAKDYVNTIDEETGKPYLDRTEDEVHGITLGELKEAIDLTLTKVEKAIDDLKQEDNSNPGDIDPDSSGLIYVENYVDVEELKLRLRGK